MTTITLPLVLSIDEILHDAREAAWSYIRAADEAGISYWSPSDESVALWESGPGGGGTDYLVTRLRKLSPYLSQSQSVQASVIATWIAHKAVA